MQWPCNRFPSALGNHRLIWSNASEPGRATHCAVSSCCTSPCRTGSRACHTILGNTPSQTESRQASEAHDATRLEVPKTALLQPRQTHLQTELMVAMPLTACSGGSYTLLREMLVESPRGRSQAPVLKHLHSAAPQVP